MGPLSRILCLSVVALALPAWAAQAQPVERVTCAAVKDRGYVGGCPTMENQSVTIDVPEANVPDPGTACARAIALATHQMENRLRAADRARPGNLANLCSNLTIRCQPACDRVEK